MDKPIGMSMFLNREHRDKVLNPANPAQGVTDAWLEYERTRIKGDNPQGLPHIYFQRGYEVALAHPSPAIPVKDVERAFELWFFRDLVDEQRLKLFSLIGAPTEEITSLGIQKHVLRDFLSRLRAGPQEGWRLVPEEPTEAMLATQCRSRPDLAKSDKSREIAERLNASMRKLAADVWRDMISASTKEASAATRPGETN